MEIVIQSSSPRLCPFFFQGGLVLVEETRPTSSRESSSSSSKCATFHLSLFWMSANRDVLFCHLHCAIINTLYPKPRLKCDERATFAYPAVLASPGFPRRVQPLPRVSSTQSVVLNIGGRAVLSVWDPECETSIRFRLVTRVVKGQKEDMFAQVGSPCDARKADSRGGTECYICIKGLSVRCAHQDGMNTPTLT